MLSAQVVVASSSQKNLPNAKKDVVTMDHDEGESSAEEEDDGEDAYKISSGDDSSPLSLWFDFCFSDG